MASKIIISPKASGFKQKRVLRDLNIHLKSKGIKTQIGDVPHKKGSLGNGVVRGITAILTGGEGFFTKLGEAVVQYVINKKTELSIKNDRGQEIALNSTMSHDQIHAIINNFLTLNGNAIIPRNDDKKKEGKAEQDEKPERKKRIPAKRKKKTTSKKKAQTKPNKTSSSLKLKKKDNTTKKRKPASKIKKKARK
ncbi:MAG: hypothetical protein U9Q83_00585 [Bacteroidota bacterium]|nr:hypothetical protein [Bacteroidota bacterium]